MRVPGHAALRAQQHTLFCGDQIPLSWRSSSTWWPSGRTWATQRGWPRSAWAARRGPAARPGSSRASGLPGGSPLGSDRASPAPCTDTCRRFTARMAASRLAARDGSRLTSGRGSGRCCGTPTPTGTRPGRRFAAVAYHGDRDGRVGQRQAEPRRPPVRSGHRGHALRDLFHVREQAADQQVGRAAKAPELLGVVERFFRSDHGTSTRTSPGLPVHVREEAWCDRRISTPSRAATGTVRS